MSDEINYFFAEDPYHSDRAIRILEQKQGSIGDQIDLDNRSRASINSVLQGEKEAIQDYRDELEPYNQFLNEAYQDFEVPGPQVLERVEEDMSIMAKERETRLEGLGPRPDSRKTVLDQFLPEGLERPIMSDTWAVMQEAQGLREYIDRRL